MLASMIFRKEPFFHGQDNYDQVSKHHQAHIHLGANAKKIAPLGGVAIIEPLHISFSPG